MKRYVAQLEGAMRGPLHVQQGCRCLPRLLQSSQQGVVTRVRVKSLFSGRLNEMDVPATLEQVGRWQRGESLLVAMPDLQHEHIEFLVSGMSRAERRKRFGPSAL